MQEKKRHESDAVDEAESIVDEVVGEPVLKVQIRRKKGVKDEAQPVAHLEEGQDGNERALLLPEL